MVSKLLLFLLARSNSLPAANYIVTTPAEMVSAAAAVTSGQIIEVQADITAAVTGTLLTFNASGFTIRADGANIRTLSGYCYKVTANGNYTPVVISSGIKINGTGANTGSANLGTFQFDKGYLKFYGTLYGDNGATRGQRVANGICLTASTTVKCYADFTGATVYGCGTDNVSAFLSEAGKTGTGSAGTDQVASGSYFIAKNCTNYTCGTGTSDNLWTSHDGWQQTVDGGICGPGGGGPMINCAPATSKSRAIGVTFDMTGASSTNNDLHFTELVGCKFINNTNNVRIAYIHKDDSNPTGRSVALRNDGINIVAHVDNQVEPLIGGNTNTLIGTNGGFYGQQLQTAATCGIIAFNNSFIGAKTTATGAAQVVTYRDSYIYNDSMDVPPSAGGGTFAVRTVTPASGSQTTRIYSCDINASGQGTMVYASRSDAASTLIALKDTKSTATTAVGFNTLGTNYTASNCTTNGSTPSGASVGASNACAELVAQSFFSYSGYASYIAAQPAVGAGGWGTDYRTQMGI